MSVQEYGAALAEAIKPLDSALKALGKASGYKGLESRVTAVEKAADQAVTELTEINPPAEVAAEHAKFLVALEGFQEEVAGMSAQVKDRALAPDRRSGAAWETRIRRPRSEMRWLPCPTNCRAVPTPSHCRLLVKSPAPVPATATSSEPATLMDKVS